MRIALLFALCSTFVFAQCDGCEGGGCDPAQAPSCEEGAEQLKGGGCGVGELVAFPIQRLHTDADRLALARQLVRAQLPLCDLDFEDDVLLVKVAPGAELSLQALEASMASGPFALDRERFVLPAHTRVKLEGMSCMGCAPDVKRILGEAPGVQVLDVQVGQAALQIEGKMCPVKLGSLFEDSRFTVTGVVWGDAQVEAPSCCPQTPAPAVKD